MQISNLLVKFSTSQNQKFSLSLDIQANIYRRERCLEDDWGMMFGVSVMPPHQVFGWLRCCLTSPSKENTTYRLTCVFWSDLQMFDTSKNHTNFWKNIRNCLGFLEFFRSCLWLSSVLGRRQEVHLVGGFQPIWKNVSQIGNLPQIISK